MATGALILFLIVELLHRQSQVLNQFPDIILTKVLSESE